MEMKIKKMLRKIIKVHLTNKKVASLKWKERNKLMWGFHILWKNKNNPKRNWNKSLPKAKKKFNLMEIAKIYHKKHHQK